jgi:hypothetical protein
MVNGWSIRSLERSPQCSLYEVVTDSSPSKTGVKQYVVSTPETRAICNDPFIAGISYTRALQKACTKALAAMRSQKILTLAEQQTIVLHILRGGLNFGLREAIADAFNFNYHPSAFVSAQRIRKSSDSPDWIITESGYQKLSLHETTHVVFGDVVATGTSLHHGLKKMAESSLDHGVQVSGITFFTIGSPRSHEVLDEMDQFYRSTFDAYRGAVIVYLEGVFDMATFSTPMRIKIDGTDLLRTNSLLAPEFVESQYENPCFPLERCTIYDAGSRAFDIVEYFEDVMDYWTQTLGLAKKGVTYKDLLRERFHELDASRFGTPNLEELCKKQISKIPIEMVG